MIMSLKVFIMTSALWCTIGSFFILQTTTSQWQNGSLVEGRSGTSSGLLGSNGEAVSASEESNQRQRTEPYWVYKHDFMKRLDEVAEDKRVCFVHVGKTAGSTLACYLGFQYDHCSTGLNITNSWDIPKSRSATTEEAQSVVRGIVPDGNLAQYTTSLIHRYSNSCLDDKPMSIFFFVVRNPLTRIQSWFEYERPRYQSGRSDSFMIKKPLFIDCKFDTLNLLGGRHGLGSSNTTSCSQRAWRAITGETGYKTHNKYNYGYYYKQVMNQDPNARIAVIRTEHLVQDWNSIETQMLDGSALPSNFTFAKKNRSPKRAQDKKLSSSSQRNICHALCEEIQVYKTILQKSENLDKTDYAESMHELAQNCPEEAGKASCD
jgi:hypothetical protein